jgi:hypothetical protein
VFLYPLTALGLVAALLLAAGLVIGILTVLNGNFGG